jgi:hypothetical protein
MFFLGGLFFFVHGLRGVWRKSVWKRQTVQYPSEPWRCDFRWHVEGMAFSAFDDMLKRLLAALIWTAFLVPFGWLGASEKGARIFLYAAAFLGLVGLVFWFRWAAMLRCCLISCATETAISSTNLFRIFSAERFARLRCSRHISAIEQLTLTLRCVQEKYVTSGTGSNRTTNVVCYELYKNVLQYDHERLTGLAGGDIPVEFTLPTGEPTTTLIAAPPTYWEIEAKGKARGIDYEGLFLVPVYAMT